MQGINSIAIAITLGLGILGPSIGMGVLVGKGMEAIGRNPGAVSKIQTNMVLGLAFTEALAIYCLVVSLILKFV